MDANTILGYNETSSSTVYILIHIMKIIIINTYYENHNNHNLYIFAFQLLDYTDSSS